MLFLTAPFQPPTEEWEKIMQDTRKNVTAVEDSFSSTCQSLKVGRIVAGTIDQCWVGTSGMYTSALHAQMFFGVCTPFPRNFCSSRDVVCHDLGTSIYHTYSTIYLFTLYCMAELVHCEKEHSDWFPERSEFCY